jgi:hypothetical protein
MQLIQQFWENQMALAEQGEADYRNHLLPLARIKKVMKTEEEVRNKMVCRCSLIWVSLDLRCCGVSSHFLLLLRETLTSTCYSNPSLDGLLHLQIIQLS